MEYQIQTIVFNISLSISLVYVISRIQPFYKPFKNRNISLAYYIFCSSFISIISMLFPIKYSNGYLVDIREVPIAILGYYNGFWPAFISAIIVSIARFYIGGEGAIIGILSGCLIPAIIASLFYKKDNYKTFNKDYYKMLIIGILIWITRYTSLASYSKTGFVIAQETWLMGFFSLNFSLLILSYIVYDSVKDKRLAKELETLSYTDGLTGLYNYRYFYAKLEDFIKKQKSFSILIMDIDYFKNYNDNNGHLEGDNLLKQLSGILRKLKSPTDIIARYGGEEFILLTEKNIVDAKQLAECIRKEIEITHFEGEENQPNGNLTVSIGIANFPESSQNPNKIVELADKALYIAKQKGRNRVEVYDF